MKGILGKKLGMAQLFKDDKLIAITLIEAGPCVISGIKTVEKHGYSAIQLGYGAIKKEKLNKPDRGQFESKKMDYKKVCAEIRQNDVAEFKVGQQIDVQIFNEGEMADVTGISKGKGFAGPMKRWNFKGQGASHGSHRVHRAPGSIGASASPSRVFKGKKMAGRMGNERVMVKSLEIVKIDAGKNLLALKGAVPGGNGSIVLVRGKS